MRGNSLIEVLYDAGHRVNQIEYLASDQEYEAWLRTPSRVRDPNFQVARVLWIEPANAVRPADARQALARRDRLVRAACESGWTGDRCTFPLFHDGPHSND